MFEEVGLNLNNLNTAAMTNPFTSYAGNMMMNPFCGAFSFKDDFMSQGLYSHLNTGSYATYSPSIFNMPYLPMPNINYYMDKDTHGLSLFPSMFDAYNSFMNGGIYGGYGNFGNPSAPRFQFSVPSTPISSYGNYGGGINMGLMDSGFGNLSAWMPTAMPLQSTTPTVSKPSVAKPSANLSATGSKTLTAEFVNKAKQVAQHLNCDYNDLIALMNMESSLNPQAKSRSSSAVGLIQFTTVAIKALNSTYGMNLTAQKILNMSAVQQLDLVEKCIMMSKKRYMSANARLSAGDLYALVFTPAYAKKSVLARRGDKFYAANSGLDHNGDGVITKQDLANKLDSKRVSVLA